jgi:hypothetical protein
MEYTQGNCDECGREFDLTKEEEMKEFWQGHNCEGGNK